jgi:hypothetical protein
MTRERGSVAASVSAGRIIFRWMALLLVLFSGACAPGLRVQELQVGFTGESVARMRGNVLGGSPGEAPRLEFNLERVTLAEEPAQTFVRLEYLGSDWLRIRAGESLLLTLDGELFPLSGEGSEGERRAVDGQFASEVAIYEIEPETAARIAQATTASVSVRGAAGPLRRSFSARNLQNVRQFLERYPV